MERQTSIAEQNGLGFLPDEFPEHPRFRSREDQTYAFLVFGHLLQPFLRMFPIWRIAPDESEPRLFQSVVLLRVVMAGGIPGSRFRKTRIQVERPQRVDDFLWSEPFMLPRLVPMLCFKSNVHLQFLSNQSRKTTIVSHAISVKHIITALESQLLFCKSILLHGGCIVHDDCLCSERSST